MKKHLIALLFVLCTCIAYGQYREYSKSDFERISSGASYNDIRLTGFKDNEHARRVLNAISAKGHLKQDKSKGPNGYYITSDGDFVIQTTKKVGLLFKDSYVLHYRPQYLETAINLEFYKLDFKPWDHAATEGRSSVKPSVNVKPVQMLVDEVKESATLFASNETELQSVQNEWNQLLASHKQEWEEEDKAREEKYTDLQVALTGFGNAEYAYEALNESIRDFNNKSAEKNGNGIGAAFTDAVNWKKIKSIQFFEDQHSSYEGKLLACTIGKEGSVQSGYIIFNVNYKTDSSRLVFTRVEMLKIPGVIKRYYDRSRFETFKNREQLGLTSDDTYQKHAVYILDEIVKHLNKYKNSPEFANFLLAKRKDVERKNADEQKRVAENEAKEQKRVAANRNLHYEQFNKANKAMLRVEEGDKICLFTYSDYSDSRNLTSNTLAYVEKYNSTKTKVQVRIHQESGYSTYNIYDGIRFAKGDLIWISLPMSSSQTFWAKCE